MMLLCRHTWKLGIDIISYFIFLLQNRECKDIIGDQHSTLQWVFAGVSFISPFWVQGMFNPLSLIPKPQLAMIFSQSSHKKTLYLVFIHSCLLCKAKGRSDNKWWSSLKHPWWLLSWWWGDGRQWRLPPGPSSMWKRNFGCSLGICKKHWTCRMRNCKTLRYVFLM